MPKQLERYVESYGYVEELGSYSDVADLTAEYEIPHINVSVGYHAQHTNSEELHLDELNLSLHRVFRMLNNPYRVHHVVSSYYTSNILYGGYPSKKGTVTYYPQKVSGNAYLRTKFQYLKDIFIRDWSLGAAQTYAFTATEMKQLDDIMLLAYSLMEEGYHVGHAFEEAWDSILAEETHAL